jgi:hypothetical protein
MYHHPNLIDLPDPDVTPRRFEANAAQTYQLLAVGLVLLAAGAVAAWYWQNGELQGRMGALPFLLLPVGAVVTGLQLRNLLAPLRVDLTPDGFAVGGEACRWDEVAAVREQLDPGSRLNGLTVWVRRADGHTFRLSAARLAGLDRLLAVVHHHTLPRLAAEARAAVDRGEAVEFGPVEVGAAGLRARGRVLAWGEVAGVLPDEAGDLGVWAAGRGRAWLDVPTGRVDNVRVLLQLVGEYAPADPPGAPRPAGR